MEGERILKNRDIINLVYNAQEDEIDKIIKKADKEIKEKIVDINLEEFFNNGNATEGINKVFKDIEDNYNIRISKYNEEMYKQGFIDGVNLILNCLSK